MILVKLSIFILIIMITTRLGFLKVNLFKTRVEELQKFKSALVFMKTKIEFTYDPIKNIFEDISAVVYENKENVFSSIKQNTNDFFKEWEKGILIYKDVLKKEDIQIIRNFGKMLGKTDKNGQISEIDLCAQLIDKQIKDAEKILLKNEKLYKTLGVTSGISICIILI